MYHDWLNQFTHHPCYYIKGFNIEKPISIYSIFSIFSVINLTFSETDIPPIIIIGKKAVIGRPPEKIYDII